MFRQKAAKLSKQHFLAIVMKPMGLGIRARKLRSRYELTCSCGEDESKMAIAYQKSIKKQKQSYTKTECIVANRTLACEFAIYSSLLFVLFLFFSLEYVMKHL